MRKCSEIGDFVINELHAVKIWAACVDISWTVIVGRILGSRPYRVTMVGSDMMNA